METTLTRSTLDETTPLPPVPEDTLTDPLSETVTSETTTTTSGDSTVTTDNPLTAGLGEAMESVVVYLTQNSTTHHKDEVPESLASLDKAEKDGHGDRSLLPISDPYADGTSTYEYAFGDAAKDMTWWQDDETMGNGQVKIGDKVLTLGSQGGETTDEEVAQIREDWRTLLLHVGLSKELAESVLQAMLTDSSGNAKLMESGAGASNELAQLIAVFARAEKGEFEIHSVVLSGHHYSDTDYLFGEDDSHNYDNDVVTGDTLSLKDIEALKGAFPKAFSQVKSVMLNACNTYALDIDKEDGSDQSTNEWLQGVFPSIESASYWEGIAPGPDMGAFFAGEFLLDTAKKDSGDDKAFKDARYRSTKIGDSKRSETTSDGTLEEIDVTRESSSYVYNDYKGLRDSAGESFTKRDDLMKKLKTDDKE